MSHTRRFVPSGIALVEERMQNTAHCLVRLQDQIESIILSSPYLANAPFAWIGMNIRFGSKNKLTPWYQGLSKKYGDLTIAIELDTAILDWCDKNSVQLLDDIFIVATLEALVHVGKKYKLNIKAIEKERNLYRDVPNSLEEIKDISTLKI